MKLIGLLAFSAVLLSFGCSNDKGTETPNPRCCSYPQKNTGKALGKATIPGKLPNGTEVASLSAFQTHDFKKFYARISTYDNMRTELIKQLDGKEDSAHRNLIEAVDAMLSREPAQVYAAMSEKSVDLLRRIRQHCLSEKKGFNPVPDYADGRKKVTITGEYVVNRGLNNDCPLVAGTQKMNASTIVQQSEKMLEVEGQMGIRTALSVLDPYLVDDLQIKNFARVANAEVKISDDGAEKITSLDISGAGFIEEARNGERDVRMYMGAFQAENSAGVKYTELKMAIVYKLPFFTALVQIFGEQVAGESPAVKVYLNGTPLKEQESNEIFGGVLPSILE